MIQWWSRALGEGYDSDWYDMIWCDAIWFDNNKNKYILYTYN